MKNFQQKLLIALALALCLLCAWQWYGQTQQRNQIDELNSLLSQKLEAIEGYTNSIKTLNDQVVQMDAHLTELKGIIKTNEMVLRDQKHELTRLDAETLSLTNQVVAYKDAVDTLQTKLKDAYDGIKKQNQAIKDVLAQRDEFVKKLNDSVKERNDIVTKYNDLVAKVEKMQSDANNKNQ